MAANEHVVSSNPYHLSFNLCAGGNIQSPYVNKNDNPQRINRRPNSDFQSSYYSNYLNSSIESQYHCDLCDRSFKNDDQLKRHISEHVTCGRSGCTFTAHPKIIANHVRMQHATGIFNAIKKLDNPEEVKKWIQERKRNYPTQKNIDKGLKLEEAKRLRGETIKQDTSRFNKNFSKRRGEKQEGQHKNSRGKRQKNRRQRNAQKPQVWPSHQPETDVEIRDIPQFCGMGGSQVKEEPEFQTEEVNFHVSDEEETINPSIADSKQPVNKSLALLCSAYDSGEDSEDEVPAVKISSVPCTQPVAVADDGDEPPEEVKTVVVQTAPDEILETINIRKRKHSREHERNPKRFNNNATKPQQRPRKPTLLQKLLKNEVERDKKIILSCVNYVARKNYLQPITNGKTQPKKTALSTSFVKNTRKPTLLHGLLKNEIIHERNVILQCVRHVCTKLVNNIPQN